VDRDPLDDDRLTLAGLLFESTTGVAQALEAALRDCSGMSAQWFELLIRLARSPGRRLRMSDLASQTALTPSGLTRAVDRLVDAELVARTTCPTDRRGAYAELTESGLQRIRNAVEPHLSHIEEVLLAPLDQDDRRDLERVLRKLRDHVRPNAIAGVTTDARSQRSERS